MQTAIMLSLIVIIYANYAFIIYAWKLESIVFPYEGTFLYSYFALFVLRLGFKRALLYCFVVLIGFIALIAQYPIYGSSSPINGSFVAITLIVGLFATYHLDSTQTKLTTLNQQLSLLSTQDPLTQLLNRRSYLQKFEQLLSYCQRTGSSVSVFMVDIDNFKHYNDHFGHLAGDDAIVKQAKILTRTFQRDTDILCRYGGEEFVVVVLDCTPQDCERMASSILQRWKMERLPHAPELDSAFLSCSIGVYSETPNSDSTPESFLKQADDALYLAKDQGKARYVRLATYATVS
jgi:diguanylate cyclase (GGDEF)-like protein